MSLKQNFMGKSISAFAYGPDSKFIEIAGNSVHVASIASGPGPMLKMENRGKSRCKGSSTQYEDQLIWILPCPFQDAYTQAPRGSRT